MNALHYEITAPDRISRVAIQDGRVVAGTDDTQHMANWPFQHVVEVCRWFGWILEQIR